MNINEIISALKGYDARINELELENYVLRQENEKLKKELNKPEASTEELIEMNKITIEQIADIVDTTTSADILMNCLTVLLDKDNKEGRRTSPIITEIITNQYLPEEGFVKIFRNIKDNVGRNRMVDKYERRLRELLKSRKLSEKLSSQIVEYYLKKIFQKYPGRDYSIKRLKYFAKQTPVNVQKKINEVLSSMV